MVFRNSEGYRNHQMATVSGSQDMLKIIADNVDQNDISIRIFGSIDKATKIKFAETGCTFYDDMVGEFVTDKATDSAVVLICHVKALSSASVSEYAEAYARAGAQLDEYKTSYVLLNDTSDSDGLSLAEVAIFNNLQAFKSHMQTKSVKNLGDILEKSMNRDSIHITALVNESDADELEKILNAKVRDVDMCTVRAGFQNCGGNTANIQSSTEMKTNV